MWRKVLVGAVIGLLGILGWAQIPNPDTMIVATIGDLETLDPAWAYDTASGTAIFNIYETLIFYDGEYVDKFVPMLATSWEISDDGLVYTFTIRKGVKFHAGGDLTPSDVVYSLQRALIQDRAGGPIWMLLDPIFAVHSIEELAEKLGSDEAVYEALQKAIRAEGDKVIITLDHAYGPFIQILAGTWASIVDKEWVIEQGGWDGTANWRPWHDPAAEASELFNKANGTGPFKLETWVPGEYISLVRNENYWREPAKLARAVIKVVPEWGTRLAMFQAGDADIIAVPRQYVAQMDELVAQGKARMMGPFPSSTCQSGFFNFYVTEGSPFMPLLGGEPKPDLLSDIHLRRAINYALDIDTYIKEAWLGEAWQLPGVIPQGRLGYDPTQPVYSFDMEKAEQELRQAWGGQLWRQGFRLTITYNQGNLARKFVAEMIERALESFNAKRQAEGFRGMFVIEVQDLPWPTYLKYMDAGQLAVFFIGWLEDYAHPDNWVKPYMHSTGAFAMNQNFDTVKNVEFAPVYATWLPAKTYDNLQALFDELIALASRETDFAKAEKLYLELNRLAHEYAINVGHIQLLARHYEQLWVRGWFYNPAYPGEYFYVLSKG
ncbi:MAG: ABC transporter substrate-binding protein [Candidatus Bipolaricaulota bacterium]|nr:ABC transporter substrate-binding protein [Candidatus Bipolaricaulota bacterium]MDW8126396.1 ABC transporter substrate-binding protein [Candidatus Bipolaricaulota bacterium]